MLNGLHTGRRRACSRHRFLRRQFWQTASAVCILSDHRIQTSVSVYQKSSTEINRHAAFTASSCLIGRALGRRTSPNHAPPDYPRLPDSRPRIGEDNGGPFMGTASEPAWPRAITARTSSAARHMPRISLFVRSTPTKVAAGPPHTDFRLPSELSVPPYPSQMRRTPLLRKAKTILISAIVCAGWFSSDGLARGAIVLTEVSDHQLVAEPGDMPRLSRKPSDRISPATNTLSVRIRASK